MQQEQQTVNVPLDQVAIQAGFNPRRHRTDEGMATLVDSVRAQGVLQSIVVRPNTEGGYYVVAGERRYRAAKEAGLSAIPAFVRELEDDTALAIATAENGVREDITIAEEARLAQRAVSASDGDKDEAARLLGWKRSRVDARLLLLHADDDVLDALEQRKISVGHAELLAGIPKITQKGTLPKIIADGITVADLKGKLGQFTRELAHARFDTAGCQGCPFNSSTQASLFEFSVGPGRCSNHECWTQKNEAHVAAVKVEQAETYPVVFFDRERDTTRRTMLFAEGAKGVGAEQYQACQSCKHFGAMVSTEPGREGAVTEGVCFNVTCNAKMVKANAEAQEEARRESSGAGTAAPDTSGARASTAAAPKKKADKPKVNAGSPKAVLEKADAFVRKQSVREHKADPVVSEALSLYGLFQLADTATSEPVKKALAQFGIKDSYKARNPALLSGLMAATPEQREAARQVLMIHLLAQRTSNLSGSMDGQGMAKAVCGFRQPDLTQTFRMNEDYLKAHTKSGMKVLLEAAGFDKWLDEKEGEGAFAKLMKAKVADIVGTVFPAEGGFDFAGFVPADVYKQAGVSAPEIASP